MKDIPGFEGRYAITSCGKVWSYHSKRFIKPYIVGNGYLAIRLDGKNYRIHRLVATAYIPNPDELPCVNHKDENKQNNCLQNLEWCDVKYNNNYGTKMEKQLTTFLGHRPHVRAYKADTKELVGEYVSQSDAARKLNLASSSHIGEVLNKKKTSYCGYIFEYVYNT